MCLVAVGSAYAQVSIPSGGIFCCLVTPTAEAAEASEGFNPVWRDFLLSSFWFDLDYGRVGPCFNPVWRDFLLSRIRRSWASGLHGSVSIPSGGIFCCLGNRNVWKAHNDRVVSIPSGGIFCCLDGMRLCTKLLVRSFNPVWRDFLLSRFMERLRELVAAGECFNPVWRDFLLSRWYWCAL